jgi:hypothetical protein
MVRVFDIRSIKKWLSCGDTKKEYVVQPILLFNPKCLMHCWHFDHQTVLAQHTVHPILISCGPGGEYSSGVSSLTVGHAYTNFPKFTIIVLSCHHHFTSITHCAACARAMSTGTANPCLRDILSSARLNNLSECLYSTRSATCSPPHETTT